MTVHEITINNKEAIRKPFVIKIFGVFLLVLAFRDKRGLMFYAIPMLILTPIGRDAIPYVFIEPSFHFWIGFTAFSVSFVEIADRRKLSRNLFRVSAVIAPFFAQYFRKA